MNGELRYLSRGWVDPFNENGMFKKIESSFEKKADAIKFCSRSEFKQAVVIDLLSKKKIPVYTKGF